MDATKWSALHPSIGAPFRADWPEKRVDIGVQLDACLEKKIALTL